MSTQLYLIIMAGLLCSAVLLVLWLQTRKREMTEELPPLPREIGRPLPPEPPAEQHAVSPFAPKKYRERLRSHWKATEERLEVEGMFPIGKAAGEVVRKTRQAMNVPASTLLPDIDWGRKQ